MESEGEKSIRLSELGEANPHRVPAMLHAQAPFADERKRLPQVNFDGDPNPDRRQRRLRRQVRQRTRSPAVTGKGSRFSAGDSGHDQRGSYAHDGLYA